MSTLVWALQRSSWKNSFSVIATSVWWRERDPFVGIKLILVYIKLWYQITTAIVAIIKIVYPTLVVVSITGIRSLIVFSMLFGVIPLLRLNVVEIRGHLSNACCLCIMTAFIFCFYVFRLTFVAANLLTVMALLPSFVNNSSFNGE